MSIPIDAGAVFFIDTNVFVYALLSREPLKKQRALHLVEHALGTAMGCVSYQVIQEFANVALRKFAHRFSTEQCKQFINAAMQPLNRVASSPALMDTALDLQRETGYGLYDCLILAAALECEASVLYSDDLQQQQVLRATLRIVNPFLNPANQDSMPWGTAAQVTP